MSIKFETERLLIREFMDSDIHYLYSLLSDTTVMKYCSGPIDMEGTKKWLKSVKKYYRKYGYDYWVAINKYTGEFIGQFGIIKQEVDNQWIDCLAFMISQNQWGKGYGTEGSKGCLKYALYNWGLKQIFATVEIENETSQRILSKIGMKCIKESEYLNKKVFLYELKNNSFNDNNKEH